MQIYTGGVPEEDRRMEIIAYVQAHWVAWLFAAITGVFGLGYRILSERIRKHQAEQERQRKEQEALKEGVLALLHDRLYQGCRYHIHNKQIDSDELKNMEYLYNGYHALGGNGTGTELYERIKKLPLKED